jgi:hypothetical protein
MSTVRPLFLSLVLATPFLLTACGPGSPGTMKALMAPPSDSALDRYTVLNIDLTEGAGVNLLPMDKQRILERIVTRVKAKAPSRFVEINPSSPNSSSLHATVQLIRYDEGNAFARFMLAGLGQIHIDANVFLEDLNSHAELRKYLITKTFAWGGFYGLGTRITDVEEGFTDGVVAAILGESDTKPEPNK